MTGPDPARPARQPLLHDLVACVAAPTSALSGPDGQIRAAGVQGVCHADVRVVAEAVLRLDGVEPDPIRYAPDGPGGARFVGVVRHLGDRTADPTVRVDRRRTVRPGRFTEHLTVTSTASVPVTTTLTVTVGTDFADISDVKSGRGAEPVPAVEAGPGQLRFATNDVTVQVVAHGGTATAQGAGTPSSLLAWPVELPPGGSVTWTWEARATDPRAVVAGPATGEEWSRPAVAAADRRLARLVDQSLDDLACLRLVEPERPGDTFLGAGVPWYLTLFGRDSLWAARMLLPLGTGVAAGTLRTLARRQGARRDDSSGEAPGKIIHEVRRAAFTLGEGLALPAAYYGTVDATPLWVSLLHDAWRWGLPDADVEPLLPHLEAALGWLGSDADADGDGFIEYVDTTGTGLANQGWKDSADAVRFRDGTMAEAPIALCEVQGYAYAAAVQGATLLDAYGRPGGDRWREWAAALAGRFRQRFWVDGPAGPYPAMALDDGKRPVDALTSNIGHLLGTGLLTPAESAAIAARLGSAAMDSGYGLRTMSAEDGGYRSLSYHCGSVWAHDTAIVIGGLARDGHHAVAASLAEGLLSAAEAFDYRLPELYAGDGADEIRRPVPYPASCRPQAWAATAAVEILAAALGLDADVPAGRLTLRPLAGAPLGAIRAQGLRLAGHPLDAAVDAAGNPTARQVPAGIAVHAG